MNNIKYYFDGKLLYGDDFCDEEINNWYNEEFEAYSYSYGKFINKKITNIII